MFNMFNESDVELYLSDADTNNIDDIKIIIGTRV